MTTSLRAVAAAAALLAVLLAACGTGAPVAGDTTQIAPVVPGDGDDAARCLPDAVDCDDTPGSDEPGPADDGDAMVPEEITIVDAVPADARGVELAGGSVDETWAVFLQSAVVDGRDVTVTFSGGEAPCSVVDHVETDENAERVIVSVMVGMPDPGADCTQQEISTQSVSLQLEEPLGDRPLKDGSRTVPDDAQA
ncbi:MAG: hypothetical protein KY461_00705 [Actinobacteria bacterium]|nr:hypothetical protein [Actinomycetota bacterium]